MILSTAVTRVRYRIGEPTPSFWTAPELVSYINDAKDDLFNAILTINKDFFQKTVTLKTSASTNRILLPSDFQRVKSLRMTTVGMEATIFTSCDRNTPLFQTGQASSAYSNQPYQYLFDVWNCIDVPGLGGVDWRGWNLELSPAPNNIYDIALCYCAQLPDLVADGDSFSFMDPFTGYILDQATYYALSKGPSGDYQNYGSRAEMKLNRILAVASKPNMQDTEFVSGFLEDSY